MDGDRDPDASSATPPPPAAAPDALPASLLAEWRAAEERLYPMVMVIPEAYERVVSLVGAVTVELQMSCPDIAALVAAAPGIAGRMRQLAEENGFGSGLDFPLIAAAACLMRYRQLEAESDRDQRRRKIAAARASGAQWVTLIAGQPPTMWPPLPTVTLEMHLASGRALEQTTAIDGSSGAPSFTLAEIRLDPVTGETVARDGRDEVFDDLHEWRAASARRRQMIESDH